jgi:hypothetical protein
MPLTLGNDDAGAGRGFAAGAPIEFPFTETSFVIHGNLGTTPIIITIGREALPC